jgi:hypothetical protein
MKRLYVIGIAAFLVALIVSVFLWISYSDFMFTLKHDTNRWAAIVDRQGSQIAVEPADDEVWEELTRLSKNKSTRFVGGIVEQYESRWGFRLKPENVTVAEFTAEGLQATIRYISENLDYWLGGWAYISSRVTEVHSQ